MKLSLPILAAVLAASHPAGAAPRNDLSFVTANMLDFNDLSPEGNWQTRYANLAHQIALSGAPPDIISLDEIGGWQSCIFGPTAGDYDGFDQIIYQLHLQTGVQYRIAFYVGALGSFGGIGKTRCNKFSGSAVLYNPTRIFNRTPADAIGRTVSPHDTSVLGFGLRRSLPICSRGTSLEPIASLIDGPLTSEKCSTATPSGPAWTWSVQPAGVDQRIAVALGRFSFVSEPTTSFDVFTIHTVIADEAAEAGPIDTFITTMSGPSFRTLPRTIPTIVTGDYNSLASNTTWLTGITHLFNADDMTASQGNPPGSTSPSYNMIFNGTPKLLPADDTTCKSKPADGISDHCAIRTDYNFAGGAPTPPPLPPFELVTFPQRLTTMTGNWAPAADWVGECDSQSAVTGLSIYNDGYNDLNRMLCRADAPSSTFPHQGCRAVSIDLGQNRGTTVSGDWDPNYYKGECAVNEYVAGVSELYGAPDQLLCCPGAVAHASCSAIVIDSDVRETTDSFDWDPWNPKAECGYGRYVAGVSRSSSDRTAHSILCCNEDAPEVPPPFCKGGVHNPSCN